MPEVIGKDFPTARAGRPVRVDITPLQRMADEYAGEVVCETYDEKDAQSVRRQFLKMPQYQVMTAKAEENGHRVVMVKRTGSAKWA